MYEEKPTNSAFFWTIVYDEQSTHTILFDCRVPMKKLTNCALARLVNKFHGLLASSHLIKVVNYSLEVARMDPSKYSS